MLFQTERMIRKAAPVFRKITLQDMRPTGEPLGAKTTACSITRLNRARAWLCREDQRQDDSREDLSGRLTCIYLGDAALPDQSDLAFAMGRASAGVPQ